MKKFLSFLLSLCMVIGLFIGTLTEAVDIGEEINTEQKSVFPENTSTPDISSLVEKHETLDEMEDSLSAYQKNLGTLQKNIPTSGDSGTCGDNLSWEIDRFGYLRIRGTGEMWDYSPNNSSPWYQYHSDIEVIEMLEGVASIGNYAFYSCAVATRIIIPSTVASIGDDAFRTCRAITSIVLPNGVTSVGNSVFYDCSKLESVTFSESLVSIGSGLFTACVSLSNIYVDENNPAYADIDGVLFNKDHTNLICFPIKRSGSYIFPETVNTISDFAFSGCTALTDVTIPNGVVSIGNSVFRGCHSLTDVVMGENVTSIGESAFSGCNALDYIAIPNSVTSIGKGAFVGCSSLVNISVPDGVSSIAETTFYGCSSLTDVTLGRGIQTIGNKAFYECSELTDVYYRGAESMWENVVIDSGNESLQNASKHILGLSITKQPVSVQVEKENDVASAVVEAKGDGLTYQWYIKDPSSTSFKKSAFKKALYSTKVTETSNGRLLYCVVSDKYGNRIQTDIISFHYYQELTIVLQPESIVVEKAGDTANTTVLAKGEGLTYQWYFKNPGLSEFTKSQIKKATYSTKVTELSNGRELYCVITDKYGNSVQTEIITFTIKREFNIISQPGNAVVEKIGDTIQTKVVAAGEGLTYQWYIKNPGSTSFIKSAIKKTTYSTTLTEASNGRELYCIITDKYGNSVRTDTVTLTALPTGLLTLRLLPENVTAENSTVTLSINAVGDGVTYAWYYKDAGQASFYRYDCAESACVMELAAENSGRQVFCVITDANGNRIRSNTCTLSV